MFDLVLLSVDGSPDSEEAVQLTCQLATVHGDQGREEVSGFFSWQHTGVVKAPGTPA